MKRGSPERLSGQIIPDNLAWIRTYHAYHAYHAPFPSDLPRIPRISRTISVGHFCTTHEAKYTHNFKRRLKQRTYPCVGCNAGLKRVCESSLFERHGLLAHAVRFS